MLRSFPALRRTLLSCLLAGAAAQVGAHDTWFERRPGDAGAPTLALGTGNVFPLHESGIDRRYLARQGCRAGALPVSMQPLADEPRALVLRALPQASTCWAQLAPFEVTLAPDKIALYLREIGAGPELRATWAAMQARGLPWTERYTKHARIELGDPAPQPVAMGMDIVIDHPGPLKPGDLLQVQVLRDGRPLADQAVELRSGTLPVGLWRRSDADGRLQVPLPAAGRWLLRAVDLRSLGDTWESRFATLAFEVRTAAP